MHERRRTITIADKAPDTCLHGRALILARPAWAVLALVALTIAIAAWPAVLAHLRTTCTVANECALGQAGPATERALSVRRVSLDAYAAFLTTLVVAKLLLQIALSAVILRRKSDDWLALLVTLTFIVQGASGIIAPLREGGSVWQGPANGIYIVQVTLYLLVFSLFPDGRFVPRWARLLPLGYLVVVVAELLFRVAPGGVGNNVNGVLIVGFFGALLGVQLYRFWRVSGPIARQQTKLVVFGLSIAIGGHFGIALLGILAGGLEPGSRWWVLFRVVSVSLESVLHLTVAVAILRYRLWDIDLLINRSLVYGALTITLALTYATSIGSLQAVLRALTGQSSQLAIVASTLVIAALFQPLRRRIQTLIDRRFYRRKYDAQKILSAFSATLRDETDLERLSAELIAVVEATMQPTHVSLWLRPPEGHE